MAAWAISKRPAPRNFARDARIAAIYEGTNGIQAIDLVQRKLGLSGGAAVHREIADMRAAVGALRKSNAESFGDMEPCLAEAVDALERATHFHAGRFDNTPRRCARGRDALFAAFCLRAGGTALARGALAAHRLSAAGNSDSGIAGADRDRRVSSPKISPPARAASNAR